VKAAAAIGIASAAMTVLALAAPMPPLVYLPAPRGDQVDDYHGVKVSDPYRWLEDIDSPAARAWISAEGALTRRYLDAIPGRAAIASRVRSVWNFPRWTPPVRYGGYWFYSQNDGLQNQSVVYVTRDPMRPGRVLVDPNRLSKDGTVSLNTSAISDDGHYFAYALSESGSDWQVWHVRAVASGKDLPDVLRWSKAGAGSWRKDGTGFYYTRYDPPKAAGEALKSANQYQKLAFHRLGTAQSADTLIYTRTDDPGWFVGGSVTDDGRYLVLQANFGDDVRNTVLVQDQAQPSAPIVPIIATPAAEYDVIGSNGTMLFVHTDDDAPRYRIIGIDIAHPDRASWQTLVAEGSDTILAATLAGDQIIVNRLKDAHSLVERYTLQGQKLGAVALPGIGTVDGFYGHADDTATYYSYESLSTPPSILRLDLKSGAVGEWRRAHPAGFAASEYETTQEFATSKDGTRVPVYITSRRGAARDGNNPTILYGYGGFNIAKTPIFLPAIAAWVAGGGVYAYAVLRGGSEYGRAWHEAGMKTRKQNVFDDFIAVAEHLIEARWTSSRRLAINGHSNGGLLVAAVELQRPDLAAAAVPEVGVLDMLRFREFTVGKGWESDYGSVDNPDEFKAMLAYSPYQNVRAGVHYPPTLIMSADHDDRVFPAHSFKFAAAMQHADPNGEPILLRVETQAGHGDATPTAKQIDAVVDTQAFVLQAFKMAQ
jgi:prolyl oligopeptidase